ncbi:MAG: sugar-binding transcriptional regulator [Gammaproteobacteria bacterium]|nr:sugar-binding transcriptional regulator [Gammaproteobacteria bacterium]
MHYAGGLTQAEVADRLGLSKPKAHRLITRANRIGIVKVYIDGEVAECVQLEQQLCEQFSLDYCEVVPDFDHDELPLRALGLAGGQYLHRLLDGATVKTVGLGHGRTMAACVENIPRTRGTKVEFVSLLGGFSRKFAANPHDVIHRLAERTGAPSYVLPVPFVADSIKDRDILMGQSGLQKVMELARTSPLKVAGVGDLQLTSTLVATEMVSESDIEKVIKAGGAGELLGNFFADDGSPVNTSLSRRTIGLSVDDIQSSQVIGIAGGSAKSRAIRAVLQSQLLSGLITDERTAKTLV